MENSTKSMIECPVCFLPLDFLPDDDASFVDALDVVRTPSQCVGDCRIDARCAEKGPHVLHCRVAAGEEHDEADDRQRDGSHVEKGTLARSIPYVANSDCQQGGDSVGWD